MARTLIKCGTIYNNTEVLSIAQNKPKKYNCRCVICGKKFVRNGQGVLRSTAGCIDCSKQAREKAARQEIEKDIGKKFGDLTLIKALGPLPFRDRRYQFGRFRCSCGNFIDFPFTRAKMGRIKTCGHDREKNLKDGIEKNKDLHVSGTYIKAIDGTRAKNKNNKSGTTGVSQMKNGKYRANINFRRHQYHLGSFSDINDAIAVRKKAEEKIYGGFLEWYASEYPDKWDKLQSKKNKNNERNE